MIPTAVTPEEMAALGQFAENRLVYEAGALLGASTIGMAQRARFVVSVDPHDGYPRRNPSPTWEPFLANLEASGYASRVLPVRARLEDAPPIAGYGFAFADLTGQHDVTLEFLLRSTHVPRVAVHDYGRSGCEGATQAVDWFIRTHRRRAYRVGTLIVLEP